jgi:acyl-CoA synthetase (AMP-forming)/AMP-acid ligase II
VRRPHMATVIEAIAAACPADTAIVQGGRRLTYREFEDRAARMATVLADLGIGRGDPVGLYLPNCPEYLEVHFAALKLRAIPVNLNFLYHDDELQALLEDAGINVLVSTDTPVADLAGIARGRGGLALLEVGNVDEVRIDGARSYEASLRAAEPRPPIERDPSDLMMLYTGGTTGTPKAVIESIGELTERLGFRNVPQCFPVPAGVRRDLAARAVAMADHGVPRNSLVAAPLMHAMGIYRGAYTALLAGGTVAMLEQSTFSAEESLRIVQAEQCALLVVAGNVFARRLASALDEARRAGRPYDVSHLRVIASAGAALSKGSLVSLFAYMPSASVIEGCGATEGAYGFAVRRAGDIGDMHEFVAVEGLLVLDDDARPRARTDRRPGLLATPSKDAEYLNDADRTKSTFRTIAGARYAIPGDLGAWSDPGVFVFLGRGSATINTGGEKVHPAEVEDVISAVDGVGDCAVFGVPDEEWGERVVALVCFDVNTTTSIADVDSRLRSAVARYKVPKEIIEVESIPRRLSGKIDVEGARRVAVAVRRNS